MPKKKYQYKKEKNITYSAEEAEFLGMPEDPDEDAVLEELTEFAEEEIYQEISEEGEDSFEETEDDEEYEEEFSEEEEIAEEETESKQKNKKKTKSLNKKPSEKEKYYVNPSEFDTEIVKYYESGHMSDNLAQMISKIANKLSYAPNFINYTYREEMVGDGIIRMFKALVAKKYDIAKGKSASAGPFSYFTRIAFNAFRNRIKREKHLRETHEKYQQELMMFSESYNTVIKNHQMRISKNNHA